VELRVAVARTQSMHSPGGMDETDAFLDCAAAMTMQALGSS
jgi:hypothetical protein